MASIDMTSILAKARACMEKEETKKEVRKVVDDVMRGEAMIRASGDVHTIDDIASKFIEVLRWEIENSGLSPNAINSISDIGYSYSAISDSNDYLICVFFTKDLSRPSLMESKYGSINDLAELFNDGVDHKMRAVHGTWHGDEVWSRTVIPGTHFMEQAITDFMGNYGYEYNVKNIELKRT